MSGTKRSKLSDSDGSDEADSWDNSKVGELNANDITQLLKNRRVTGETLRGLKNKRDKVEHLLNETDIELKDNEIDSFIVRQLQVELKLRGIPSDGKKEVLVHRLKHGYNGEIDEPPAKKRKTSHNNSNNFSRKRRSWNNDDIFVVMYAPEDNDSENCEPRCVGVYTREQKAYDRGIKLLLSDLEQKKKKAYTSVIKDLKRQNFKKSEYKEKFAIVNESVKATFKEGKEPYAEIQPTKLGEDISI
mmetsp:Transcript_41943/g.51622  ORF Transcript_41943/g.51622 Transcript_41943/m.51622 type:complete len:245 (+) Transcript_41943:57-791(+)